MSVIPKPPRRSKALWGSAFDFGDAFDFIRGHQKPKSYVSPLPGEILRSNPEVRNIRYFFSLKTQHFHPFVYSYALHHTQPHRRTKSPNFNSLGGVVPIITLYHTTVSSQFFWRYYMFFYLMTDRAFCFSPFQAVYADQRLYFRNVDKRYTGRLI